MPGPAALSTKHTLALTNRGGATAADVVALAREIRDGVQDTFGVTPGQRAGPGRHHALSPCGGRPVARTPADASRGGSGAGRRRQPGVDVVQQASCAAPPAPASRAPTRGPGPRARSSPSPSAVRADSYCAASRDPNSSGSSAPSATCAPASSSRRSGHHGRVGVDPQGDVAAGADLEGHAPAHDLLQHRGVLDAADAVAEPVRPQRGEGLGHGVRAQQLAAVRDAGQPGAAGDVEGVARSRRCARAARRCSARTRPRCPGPRRRSGRPAGPACGRPAGAASATAATTTADAGAGGRRRRRRASSSTISSAGVMPPRNGAYDVGSTWISSQREPSAASSCGRLAHDAAHVLLVAHAGPGHVIQPLEPEPPALVAWRAGCGGHPVVSASGSLMACLSASASSVLRRIEPVKCRCRWALGSACTGRSMRVSVPPRRAAPAGRETPAAASAAAPAAAAPVAGQPGRRRGGRAGGARPARAPRAARPRGAADGRTPGDLAAGVHPRRCAVAGDRRRRRSRRQGLGGS